MLVNQLINNPVALIQVRLDTIEKIKSDDDFNSERWMYDKVRFKNDCSY